MLEFWGFWGWIFVRASAPSNEERNSRLKRAWVCCIHCCLDTTTAFQLCERERKREFVPERDKRGRAREQEVERERAREGERERDSEQALYRSSRGRSQGMGASPQFSEQTRYGYGRGRVRLKRGGGEGGGEHLGEIHVIFRGGGVPEFRLLEEGCLVRWSDGSMRARTVARPCLCWQEKMGRGMHGFAARVCGVVC